MSIKASMRFNFASPGGDPARRRAMMTAAVEMTRYGEGRGIAAVSLEEHHATGNGWSPNPILAAAPFLAATTTLAASVNCALAPLWNPVRLAEDIAFLDTYSGGRLHVTVGLGYRELEYRALGVDFAARGRLMDQALDTVLGVWAQSNDPDGEDGVARTWTRPHPLLFVAGAVRATARRAASRGLPLSLAAYLPDVADYYRELCRESGVAPVVVMPGEHNTGMTYLHEDPDRAWAEFGEHVLWEAMTYDAWAPPRARLMARVPGVKALGELRASGRYRFVTPDELIAEIRDGRGDGMLVLHPMVGGMPIDEAWKSVHLLTDTVLPAVNTAN